MANQAQKNDFISKPIKKPPLPLFFILMIATLLCVGGFGVLSVEKQMKENFEAKKLFNLAHYKMRSTYFSVYKKIFLSKK